MTHKDVYGNELRVGDRVVFARFVDYDDYRMFYGIVKEFDQWNDPVLRAWQLDQDDPEEQELHQSYHDVVKIGETYSMWGFPEYKLTKVGERRAEHTNCDGPFCQEDTDGD